jgi:hypothetical protein
VKTADEEITDEAIKEARVLPQQHGETVAQVLARLIGDKRQVGRHGRHRLETENANRSFFGVEQIPSAELQFPAHRKPRELFISHLILSGGIKQNFPPWRKPNPRSFEREC